MSGLPLAGVRVLDLSRYLPGPYLTRLLADLGAWVAKVEGFDGDPLRGTPPSDGETSAAFTALNHGKRSLAVDLRVPAGRELFLALAANVDVVVESFRPGVLERLGLSYGALAAQNPRLILCSISGFGRSGPLAQRAGHDLTYLARAGVLGMFGPADAAPVTPGVQIADLAGGALPAAVGVLAALLERERSGVGRHVDVSLARGALALNAMELARRHAGWSEARGRGLLSGGVPCYRVYPTKDGRFMALAALEPKFFSAFCARAGCEHLDGRGLLLGEEGELVGRELERLFSARTQAEWVALLAGSESCCEPVATPEEALADQELHVRCSHTQDGMPLVHPETGLPVPRRSDVAAGPQLGADDDEVLGTLAVPHELIVRARAQRALRPAEAP